MPIAPTEAELVTQLQKIIKIRKDLRTALSTYVTNWGALIENVESERVDQIAASQRAMRKGLADGWVESQDLINHIYDWVQLAGYSLDISLEEAIDVMVYYWRAVASPVLTVLERDFTYATTPTMAGGNTGTGAIKRCTVNQFAKDLECSIGADIYKARIVQDATTGTDRGNEIWLVESKPASVDGIEQLGAGISTRQTVWHSDDSILSNSGFDNWDNPATPASLIDWDASPALAGTGLDVIAYSSSIFLPKKNALETRYSAKVLATVTFSVRLDKFRTFLDQGIPLYGQLGYNRSAFTGLGTLKTTCGSKDSSTITLSGASAGWQVLPVFVNPEDGYYKNNVADPYTFSIVITISGGALLIDDLILLPMVGIGGTFYSFPGGATAFRAGSAELNTGDTATWTDTCAETGVISREFARITNRQLPTVTSSPSVADP